MVAVGFVNYLLLTTAVGAVSVSELVGTWSTKSESVFTGEGFFDPVEDRLIEPKHPGVSYSFTSDGYYEAAYYRALANPKDPSCPKGIMQWQHGAFTLFVNGSLVLTPIAVDGRQLLSDPCKKDIATYTRYNQTEFFKSYAVSTDPYHKVRRLDLYGQDGGPLHPMYLAYETPQILPSTTLNPLHTQAPKGKRDLSGTSSPFAIQNLIQREGLVSPERWWWFGVIATSLGGIALMYA
ncbi:uncharacterized protein EURHEDRAFT_374781 [Aspergillus ruber CBS 135680]|uniref:Protein ROT1 n=1 Tax=Aspergillus ruber (strain CBS 135680) TaxID=1388766 RepID=A0A017SPJ6_ASPRC|nr:uncharacterized protein EURHEDRAFT_374781 [Aspergillus ruber CBS 135680]EYE98726.1 hypothetical protein EURHEDRAFT_374781 [Aspergillus ruber CBS 135680]